MSKKSKKQPIDIKAILKGMSEDDIQELLEEIIERLPYEGRMHEAHEKIGEKYNDWLTAHL